MILSRLNFIAIWSYVIERWKESKRERESKRETERQRE